jgi:hypothetical protein
MIGGANMSIPLEIRITLSCSKCNRKLYAECYDKYEVEKLMNAELAMAEWQICRRDIDRRGDYYMCKECKI